jgi:hypothetical protein
VYNCLVEDLLGVVSFIKRSNAWFLKVLIHIMSNDESLLF